MDKMKNIFALFFLLTLTASAQTLRSVPGMYATIASAIDSAHAGDTISIGPGIFAEQLVINKNLTLIGAGSSKTLIQEAPSIPDSTALYIDRSTVFIRDIQFNGYENTEGRRRGIVAINSNLTIRQCSFVLLCNVNIASVNGSLDLDSVTITCINSGTNTPAIDSAAADQGYGIACDNGIMLANARFTINHLIGGADIDHVIDIYPTPANTVLHQNYPLDTSQSTQGTIENSTFYGSRMAYYGQGIRIFGDVNRPPAQLCIRYNRFVGQAVDSLHAVPSMYTTAGISFNGANGFAEIYGNTIQSFNSGISVYGSSTANIHDNIITNNARYGIVTSWGGNTSVGLVDLGGGAYGSPGRNTLSHNGIYNVLNLNSNTVWALNNNWGTNDSLTIDSLIYDRNDNASLGRVNFNTVVVSVQSERQAVPLSCGLFNNFPNPFNPSTTIRFVLEHTGFAKLQVYNLIGQKITTLFDGEALGSKIMEIKFDASKLPSGIYFVRLESSEGIQVRKIIFQK